MEMRHRQYTLTGVAPKSMSRDRDRYGEKNNRASNMITTILRGSSRQPAPEDTKRLLVGHLS